MNQETVWQCRSTLNNLIKEIDKGNFSEIYFGVQQEQIFGLPIGRIKIIIDYRKKEGIA